MHGQSSNQRSKTIALLLNGALASILGFFSFMVCFCLFVKCYSLKSKNRQRVYVTEDPDDNILYASDDEICLDRMDGE